MSDGIESRLKEDRRFLPSAEFVGHARIQSHAEYAALYRQSIEEPEVFWREQTLDLVWRKPPQKFLSWELPKARFFEGARLNITESCLDRHLAALKSDADGDLRRSRRDRAYNPDEISEWAVEDSHDLADLELL